MKLRTLLPTLAVALFACREDSNPSGNVEADLTIEGLTVEQLVGTYTLETFRVEYTSGQVLSSESGGIEYAGSMTIAESGQIVQNIILNGNRVTAVSTIDSIVEDSVMHVSSAGYTYAIIARYAGEQLTLTLDATQVGQNYTETDTWRRVSASLPKTATSGIRPRHDLVGGLAGSIHSVPASKRGSRPPGAMPFRGNPAVWAGGTGEALALRAPSFHTAMRCSTTPPPVAVELHSE